MNSSKVKENICTDFNFIIFLIFISSLQYRVSRKTISQLYCKYNVGKEEVQHKIAIIASCSTLHTSMC